MRTLDLIFSVSIKGASKIPTSAPIPSYQYHIQLPTSYIEEDYAKSYLDEFDNNMQKSLAEVDLYFNECGYDDYLFNNTDFDMYAKHAVVVKSNGPKIDLKSLSWEDLLDYRVTEVESLPPDFYTERNHQLDIILQSDADIEEKKLEITRLFNNDINLFCPHGICSLKVPHE